MHYSLFAVPYSHPQQWAQVGDTLHALEIPHRRDEFIRPARADVNRLFRQNVQALLGRGDALSGMQSRWTPNNDEIHRAVRQKRREIRVRSPAMFDTEFASLLRIGSVYRSNLYTGNGARRPRMRLRNIAAANQSDMKGHGSECIKALVIRRDKGFISRFGAFRRADFRRDQHAVAERNTLAGSHRKVQFFFAIAEDFLAQRIGSK